MSGREFKWLCENGIYRLFSFVWSSIWLENIFFGNIFLNRWDLTWFFIIYYNQTVVWCFEWLTKMRDWCGGSPRIEAICFHKIFGTTLWLSIPIDDGSCCLPGITLEAMAFSNTQHTENTHSVVMTHTHKCVVSFSHQRSYLECGSL